MSVDINYSVDDWWIRVNPQGEWSSVTAVTSDRGGVTPYLIDPATLRLSTTLSMLYSLSTSTDDSPLNWGATALIKLKDPTFQGEIRGSVLFTGGVGYSSSHEKWHLPISQDDAVKVCVYAKLMQDEYAELETKESKMTI